MEKGLAEWPHPESVCKWLDVQVQTSNDWWPSKVHTGTNTIGLISSSVTYMVGLNALSACLQMTLSS